MIKAKWINRWFSDLMKFSPKFLPSPKWVSFAARASAAVAWPRWRRSWRSRSPWPDWPRRDGRAVGRLRSRSWCHPLPPWRRARRHSRRPYAPLEPYGSRSTWCRCPRRCRRTAVARSSWSAPSTCPASGAWVDSYLRVKKKSSLFLLLWRYIALKLIAFSRILRTFFVHIWRCDSFLKRILVR